MKPSQSVEKATPGDTVEVLPLQDRGRPQFVRKENQPNLLAETGKGLLTDFACREQ